MSDADDFLFMSPEALQEAWEYMCATHILPSRLFGLAVLNEAKLDSEQKHLDTCESCRRAFEIYQNAK